MSLFSFLNRRNTAPMARERLQVLLAHERAQVGHADLVGLLREEILAVIARHVQLDEDKVTVSTQRGENVSTLEVDIEIPATASVRAA
ncbi:cell division topological specificity factor MinE [Jiella mangrovi]|uniref:Cell division topological specificity factor n=1 Tax=Jiella mangrovi TaxID=2821407 RepID=A0ABS4BFP0_9HYPH|nr:cell division topological specificity factor MinE [Jiella mangrovi]MBP0615580.1 cell division topological specificity factor MinE [Jiella mangrovi]